MSARIAAIVLAAGRSTRMGDANKLTLPLGGKPLVCHVVDTLLASDVGAVHVVTGHEAQAVEQALADRPVSFVHNPDFATGMASSIAAGIRAVADADAALLCLADMPDLSVSTVAALLRAWDAADVIALPVRGGRRGHPVLFGAAHFEALRRLRGDRGARDLLACAAPHIVEVQTADPGVHFDVDTPDDLTR